MIGRIESSYTLAPVLSEPTYADAGLSLRERMLLLAVQSELSRMDVAESCIDVSSEQMAHLREQVREALAAAREAQKDAGFWGMLGDLLGGDVAVLAQLVAMTAAAAMGGPAALVLVAVAAGATLASRYAEELGLPQGVAIALGIAAGLCAAVSGNFAAGVAPITSQQLALHSVKTAAQVTSVAATGGGAASGAVAAYHESEGAEHRADAAAGERAQVLESMQLDACLAALERALSRTDFAFEQTVQLAGGERRTSQQVLADFTRAA
jgi:hypothetical protein